MTLLIDTAPLVALADAGEPRRAAILAAIQGEPGSLVIPAPTTAEIDYLLGQRLGGSARRAFLSDLTAGRFAVVALERDDCGTVADLESRYADLSLGLATARSSCSPIGMRRRGSSASTSAISAP